MKPSRRSRIPSNSTPKRSKTAPMSPPKPQSQPESTPDHSPASKSQAQSQAQAQTQSTSVTPAARYQQNLKSLRRIDPTIISIVDQFSHICLYRLHQGKWVKDGFEGASFLFERCVLGGPSTPCHPSHSSNVLELRIPLMASSFLIVPGCRITYTTYTPKTRYNPRGSISCTSLTPSSPPSVSPWPNRLQFRSRLAGRMPITEHRPPTTRSRIGAICSIRSRTRALMKL